MFPAHPDALNEAWLTAVLREAGLLSHGEVIALKIELLSGVKGAMGQLARLWIAYDSPAAALPSSLIVKCSSADPAMRALGNALGLYRREVYFYRDLAGQVAIPTPACYRAEIDEASGTSLLLLEDLAPARNGDRIAGCSPAEAALVIQTIAALHADWWMRPQISQLDWLLPFDTGPLQGAYQRAWRPFTIKLGSALPPELRAIGERFGACLSEVFAGFWEPPWTLLHNDLQLDNLFFSGDAAAPTLSIIDWQSTIRGRGMLEVAGFLGGNLSITDRRAHEMALLSTYHATLIERGVREYSFEQCYADYRIALFDGFSRMVIALASNLRDDQERAHRDVLWPRYSAAILDLAAAALLPTAPERAQ